MALLTSGTKKVLFFEEPTEDNGRTEEDLCLVIMQENIIPTYCINFSLIGYTYEQLQKMCEKPTTLVVGWIALLK